MPGSHNLVVRTPGRAFLFFRRKENLGKEKNPGSVFPQGFVGSNPTSGVQTPSVVLRFAQNLSSPSG